MHTQNILRTLSAVMLGIACAAVLQASLPGVVLAQGDEAPTENNLVVPPAPLQLLQPLDDQTSALAPSPGIQIFFDYFNLGWPWLIGSAAGIGVLWSLVGGIQVILSGGDPGKRQAGIDRLLWSLAGLSILALAGLILRTLNPLFFK